MREAHERGRRLYIGTVDLDSQRFVVWNMGLIATSGRPEALELFRKVMLASASVPVAFPPVFFDVEAGGQHYDEMHVDGAVMANVFYTGGVFSFSAARAGVGRGEGREDIYVIHNGQVLPVAGDRRGRCAALPLRVFDVGNQVGVVGDLFRIYAIAVREQAGFFWVTIPEGVELVGEQLFDPVLMGSLYDLGYGIAAAGHEWTAEPPGLQRRPAP